MLATTPARLLACGLLAALLPLTTSAQVAHSDNQGREWRQMAGTTGHTWQDFASFAPSDGVTPITGSFGGVDLGGWVWATNDQVTSLLAEFAPEIENQPFVDGPAYVLPGLFFFSSFRPTFEYYTTFGGYNFLAGWTASDAGSSARIASVSAQYPVFYGHFSVAEQASKSSADVYRGLWLYRQTPFHNIGFALAGTNGEAVLKGSGTLVAGTPTTLSVLGGRANAPALLAVGTQALNLPLLGGTFVPSRNLATVRTTLDANGQLTLTGAWPAGLASGTSVYAQLWFLDSGAPAGGAATNALRIDVP